MIWRNEMGKKVCMFVWNHFTNDARVLRECSALAEVGCDVDLICIHDYKTQDLPRFETRKEGFRVTRVKNNIAMFRIAAKWLSQMKKQPKQNLVSIFFILAIVMLGLFFFPKTTIVLGIFAFLTLILLFKLGMAKHVIRFYIFSQMVYWGRKKRYDIYHSNDLNTLPQGVLCARWFRWKKIPLVYDSHEVQTSRTGYDSPVYGWLEKFLLRFTDVMIQENHTRAAFIEELYGFYPKVLHNYPIPSTPEDSNRVSLHDLLQIPKDEPILLYQGGIQMGRGLEKIIDAVPLFHRGRMVFIGDGRIKPDLMKKVQVMNLEDQVYFVDKVPVEVLPDYTKNAYLGFQVLNNVCFNHYSASSNKLFEYLMAGVPVVACSFPEIKKVVKGDGCGVCIDSHDVLDIARGVNLLLDDPKLREQMHQNCLQARHKYNWLVEKRNFIEIYDQLLGTEYVKRFSNVQENA